MANNYNDILTLVNAGNNMGLSNTIKRDYGIPLDFTSVQESYDAAVIYAATSTLAYVGQTVAVDGKLYIISDTAAGTHTVGEGESAKTYDNYLAEVGSATEGDGNTIELDGKTLKLAGLTGLDNAKTYVPSLVNGKLVWTEPDTSTAEGQEAAIKALEVRAGTLEATVNGTDVDGVHTDGLVDKVAANTQAIANEVTAREEAEAKVREDFATADKAITDTIGAVTEGKTVVEMIADAESAAKAAIPTNVSAFNNDAGYLTAHQDISGKADKADTLAGYGITDAYTKTEVNDLVAGMTHMSTAIVDAAPSADEAEVGVIYLVADENAVGAYIEYILVVHEDGTKTVEPIGSTVTDLSDYAKSADVVSKADFEAFEEANAAAIAAAKSEAISDADGKLAAKLDTATFETFKGENTTAIATAKQEAIDAAKAAEEAKGYAVASEVDAKLADKADKADTLAGYGITDAYTKTEIDTKIGTPGVPATKDDEGNTTQEAVAGTGVFANTYSKAEINVLLDEVSGGSSETAASVKRQLDEYKATNDDRVANLETSVGAPANGEIAASGLYAAVAEAKTQADKGVADAKAANDAVADLIAGQVKTNTDDLTALKTRVDNAEGTIGTHGTKIGALEGEIAALKEVDADFTSSIDGINTKIDTIETNIANLGTDLAELDTAYKAADTAINGELTTVKATLANKADQTAVDAINAKIGTVAEDTTVVDMIEAAKAEATYDDAEVKAGIQANAEELATLIGEDKDAESGKATKSIRDIAKEEAVAEVASLIGEAPEALNSIHEIASWIENDETGAAAMAAKLESQSAILAGFGTGEGQAATVKGYVDEAIAAIPGLGVATTETLGGVKASADENKINVGADGLMEINSLNVNKLVQTTGDVLILNGGSATT